MIIAYPTPNKRIDFNIKNRVSKDKDVNIAPAYILMSAFQEVTHNLSNNITGMIVASGNEVNDFIINRPRKVMLRSVVTDTVSLSDVIDLISGNIDIANLTQYELANLFGDFGIGTSKSTDQYTRLIKIWRSKGIVARLVTRADTYKNLSIEDIRIKESGVNALFFEISFKEIFTSESIRENSVDNIDDNLNIPSEL